jgi:hypothetical protein
MLGAVNLGVADDSECSRHEQAAQIANLGAGDQERLQDCRLLPRTPAAGRSTTFDLAAAKRRDQAPQRSAAVCTGASHRAFAWPSSTDTVTEAPAMSRAVT